MTALVVFDMHLDNVYVSAYVYAFMYMYVCLYIDLIRIKVLAYIYILCILMNMHIDRAMRFLALTPTTGAAGEGVGCNNQRKQGTDTKRACGAMIANRHRVCQLSPYSHSHRSLADRAFSLVSFPSHTFPPSAFSPSGQPSLITSSLILPSWILSWRHADRR